MKLRICICLFVTVSVISLALTAGYVSLRQDYMELSRRYEADLEQKETTAAGQEAADGSEEEPDTAKTKQESAAFHTADAFYYVTLNDNEIIAYTGDHEEICMRTRIDEEELAAALIQELRQGIYLENLPALYEYLENCSS